MSMPLCYYVLLWHDALWFGLRDHILPDCISRIESLNMKTFIVAEVSDSYCPHGI